MSTEYFKCLLFLYHRGSFPVIKAVQTTWSKGEAIRSHDLLYYLLYWEVRASQIEVTVLNLIPRLLS